MKCRIHSPKGKEILHISTFYIPFSICRQIDRISQRWAAESDEIRRLRVVDRTITWSIAGLGGSEYTDLLLMGQNTYTIHLSTRSSTSSSSPRSISYQVKRSVLCRPGHTVRDMPSPPIRRGKWNPPCVTAGCSEIKALNKERLHHQPSAEPHKPLTASHTRVIKHNETHAFGMRLHQKYTLCDKHCSNVCCGPTGCADLPIREQCFLN